MATPSSLRLDLERVWAADTAADPETWSPDRPSTGQCAITALLVAEYTDATTILRVEIEGGSHYYNATPDGAEVDITRDQFDEYRPLGPAEERTVEYLLSNDGTRRRYEHLRQRLGELWWGTHNDSEVTA